MSKFYESYSPSIWSLTLWLLIGFIGNIEAFKTFIMALFKLTKQSYNLLFAVFVILTALIYIVVAEYSIWKLKQSIRDLHAEIDKAKTTVDVEHVTMAVVDTAIQERRNRTTSTQSVLNGQVHPGRRR